MCVKKFELSYFMDLLFMLRSLNLSRERFIPQIIKFFYLWILCFFYWVYILGIFRMYIYMRYISISKWVLIILQADAITVRLLVNSKNIYTVVYFFFYNLLMKTVATWKGLDINTYNKNINFLEGLYNKQFRQKN